MLDVRKLSRLGIGAWGIGGFAQADPDNDDAAQVDALAYAVHKGLNYFEINFWNSEGRSVELIKQAITKSGRKREDLFLALVLYDYKNPTLTDAESEIQRFFELFNTGYVDTLEFPLSALHAYGFDNVANLVKKYLQSHETRYASLTNANLEYLQKFYGLFGRQLFSHEVHYSFEVRDNGYLGVLDFASEHGIKNVIYQPLRRNRTAQRDWPLLVELSRKYGKTQNQIILNWLVSKGCLPLVKSQTKTHIDENVAALGFTLADNDIKLLDEFRVPGYKLQTIDWFAEGTGPTIFSLPNSFDEQYPAQ